MLRRSLRPIILVVVFSHGVCVLHCARVSETRPASVASISSVDCIKKSKDVEVEAIPSSPVAASVAVAEQPQQPVQPKGKKLLCPQMRLLNAVIEPIALVRTKATCSRAAKAILAVDQFQQALAQKKSITDGGKCITSDVRNATKNKDIEVEVTSMPSSHAASPEEKALILQHLTSILDPVKDFFTIVSEHKSLVIPVILESFGEQSQNSSNSLLIKFLNTNDDFVSFFEREVTTPENLKKAATELITVFNDLNESISDNLRKECDDIIRKMRDQKKTAAEQKTAELKKS